MRNNPFTEADSHRAFEAWGANCGPHALAVCLNLSLDQIRLHLGDFEKKRYMSPTMMKLAVYAAGWTFTPRHSLPAHGLVRVQWHGPWMANARWAYGYTHWIHCCQDERSDFHIFDVNGGWRPQVRWQDEVATAIMRSIKRSDGKYSFTHFWDVFAPGAQPKPLLTPTARPARLFDNQTTKRMGF